MRPVVLALALCAGFAPQPAAADKPAAGPLAGFDEFIARTMKAHDVPGLSVAVVKDGEVVLAKGYGVRELGKPEPVDADTVFAIGSCSKAFTAVRLRLESLGGHPDRSARHRADVRGSRVPRPVASLD